MCIGVPCAAAYLELTGREAGVHTHVLVITLADAGRKLVLLENLKGTIFEKLLLFAGPRLPLG